MSVDAGSSRRRARHVTGLLVATRDGVPNAMARLPLLVHDELPRVSHREPGVARTGEMPALDVALERLEARERLCLERQRALG